MRLARWRVITGVGVSVCVWVAGRAARTDRGHDAFGLDGREELLLAAVLLQRGGRGRAMCRRRRGGEAARQEGGLGWETSRAWWAVMRGVRAAPWLRWRGCCSKRWA